MREAQTIMRRELSRSLSLREVATQVATSPRHLQRVFGDAETTFRTQLRELRMRRAVELLRDGRRVEEVARAVGYASTHTFARAFKSAIGRDPAA